MYSEHINTIKSLKYVNDNWDGYGGRKPSNLAIVDAITLLSQLSKVVEVSRVGLSNDGEINLFVDNDKEFADFGVYGDGTYTFFVKVDGQKVYGENIRITDGIPVDVKNVLFTKALKDFSSRLASSQVECPPEIHEVVNNHFWDLI